MSNNAINSSELQNQSNLLKKLNDQLSSTFSNLSSSSLPPKKHHDKYFNQEEDLLEEIDHTGNDGQPPHQQQNHQNVNKTPSLQQNTNNRVNVNYSQLNSNLDNKNVSYNQHQQKNNNNIKLFTTNLLSFGNLPQSSASTSQHSSTRSLQNTNYSNHQGSNDRHNKQLLPNGFNNQSFANILPHQSSKNHNQPTHEMSPIFSQKSTNLSVYSQNMQLNGGKQFNDNGSSNNVSFQKIISNDSSIMQINNNNENEKIQNLVSMQVKGQVRQLYHELTLYPDDENYRLSLLQDPQKLKKQLRNSMEGLLKVLIWRLDSVITPTEFSQLYLEWQRKREIHTCLINTSSIQVNDQQHQQQQHSEQEYMWELIQKYMKDSSSQVQSQIPKIVELFKQEFNQQLQSDNDCQLGLDSIGKQISPISQKWIEEVESLYKLLDDEGRGSIDSDRIQFFLMALLLNEIRSHNREDMIILVQKQTSAIMEHMFQTFGYINLRNFKQYLLIQRLRRESEITTLKNNVKRIQKYWFKAKRGSTYTSYPVMKLFLSKFPSTLIQSIVLALNDKEFDLFILELNSSGFYQSNSWQTQLLTTQNNAQLLKIVKFVVDQFYEVASLHEGFLDGTLVIEENIDAFAEILFKKFINSNQGEINMVIQNISTFKQVFVKAIQEYSKLNNQAITDIIDQHLLLETESGNTNEDGIVNTTTNGEDISTVVNNTKETNIVESYQTQTSPPRKPNLSPIPSTNRLAQEGSQQNLFHYNQQEHVNNHLPPKHHTQNLKTTILSQQNYKQPQQFVSDMTFSPKDLQIQNNSNIPLNKNLTSQHKQQQRKLSATPATVQQNNTPSNNLPTFSLNLSQLSQQKQAATTTTPSHNMQQQNIQKRDSSYNQYQGASNLMISKHQQNIKQKQQLQSNTTIMNRGHDVYDNPSCDIYNDNFNIVAAAAARSHNSSVNSSYIPYASTTNNISNLMILQQQQQQSYQHHHQSFNSQSSSSYQEVQNNTSQHQQYTTTTDDHQYNVTPVKMSLQQQIEHQSQLVQDNLHKRQSQQQYQQYQSSNSKLNNINMMHLNANVNGNNLYQYSSQQKDQQQHQNLFIMQTPLSAVPHISGAGTGKNRDKSNTNNTVKSRLSGSVTSRQQSLRQSSSSISNSNNLTHRRSNGGQHQPQQNSIIITQNTRTKTPLPIQQQMTTSNKLQQQLTPKQYQPVLLDQKRSNHLFNNHNHQHNTSMIVMSNSKSIGNVGGGFGGNYNLDLAVKSPVSILSKNARDNSKNTQSFTNSSVNSHLKQQQNSGVRSSSQFNNYDKSPIRSRRVENYEDVIGRLMQLSVTNISNAKR